MSFPAWNPPDPTQNWKWIWHLPCTYCIQHFVWLTTQERISTRNNLFLCHIATTPNCEWCHQLPETTCHALRDCECAKAIWTALCFPISTHSNNPSNWIRLHAKNNFLIPWACIWISSFSLPFGTFGLTVTNVSFNIISTRVYRVQTPLPRILGTNLWSGFSLSLNRWETTWVTFSLVGHPHGTFLWSSTLMVLLSLVRGRPQHEVYSVISMTESADG